MTVGGKWLKPPMNEARSGSRPVRRWRVLVAHDATAPTCDALILGVERAYGNVEIIDASSVEDALCALHGHAAADGVDLCLVCLDLPPVPQGGIRLAEEVVAAGVPLVLVTRSLRWLPVDAARLRAQPWVSPEAEDIELARAMGDAIARGGLTFDGDEAFAGQAFEMEPDEMVPDELLPDEMAPDEMALDERLARASQVG
jgi:hypothetical protein